MKSVDRRNRTTGKTRDVGFQIGVRRTLSIPHKKAWRLLTSPEGVRIWLGSTAGIRFIQGEAYQLADGSSREVRVVSRNAHLRITWQPKGCPRPSTIQLRVIPKGNTTVVAFHQEHLPGATEREERRVFFAAVLDEIERIVSSPAD